MSLSKILGTNQYPNVLIFIIGYVVSMVGIYLSDTSFITFLTCLKNNLYFNGKGDTYE